MSSSKDLCVGVVGGLDRKVFGLWSWCIDWAQWRLCCASWPRVKNFPIQPDQTQSISIFSFDHWLVKNFEKLCVNRIIGSNKLVHAEQPQKILCNKNFSFFFLVSTRNSQFIKKSTFFLVFNLIFCVFFFNKAMWVGGWKAFFRPAHINLSFTIVSSWTGCVVTSYLCCLDTWLCCS